MICEPRGDYDAPVMRKHLQEHSRFSLNAVVPYLVFPFDTRSVYYEVGGQLLNRRRPELWENRQENEFLLAVPEPRKVSESRPLFATMLFDLHVHDRGTVGFPAEVKPEPQQRDLFYRTPEADPIPRANVDDQIWSVVSER